jgi:hypothetical protein
LVEDKDDCMQLLPLEEGWWWFVWDLVYYFKSNVTKVNKSNSSNHMLTLRFEATTWFACKTNNSNHMLTLRFWKSRDLFETSRSPTV